MGAAGLNAERSGHFGHCDCFTVVDIVDGVAVSYTHLDVYKRQVLGHIGLPEDLD